MLRSDSGGVCWKQRGTGRCFGTAGISIFFFFVPDGESEDFVCLVIGCYGEKNFGLEAGVVEDAAGLSS